VRAIQRALVIFTRAFGPESPRVLDARINLAVVYRADGRPDAALALNTESRAILEKTLPPHHDRLLALRGNQALVLSDLKRYDEAIAELKELFALHEAAGHPASDLADMLLSLGNTHIARGAPADAIPVLERALTLIAGLDKGFERAEIELPLAQALWASRIDRPRARRLAQATAATLRAAGPDAASLLADVERWLADPDAPRPP
jgi:tetratricopeptide (TPR) repeat protein